MGSMTGAPDAKLLLQRYRCDRRELLVFLLSSSVFKKVVMPPGAVAFEDIDLDHISVDYILECARHGGTLELAEAVKKYHDGLALPPAAGHGLDQVFFLVTSPGVSGPAPTRAPPAALPTAGAAAAASPGRSKKFSLRSGQAPPPPPHEESDEFEDAEGEDELAAFSTEITRRQLSGTDEVVLELPGFATGLSDDDLRETAYEVLLVSVGAAGGLIVPPKEKRSGGGSKKSKLARTFSRSRSAEKEKAKAAAPAATGLAGLMDTMRAQMEVSEAADWRTREGLLNASSGKVGRRMDTLLVPLELLCTVSRASFADKKVHLRWQKRQLSLLEEGLVNHPAVRLEATDARAQEVRALLARLEEADGGAEAQALRALRGVATALSERAAPVDQPVGEVCHWADGYHLNVRIYEKLLGSVFDVLEEGRLVEEVEEILELLKSTWRVLGITPIVHNTVYTWVLFRQFVMTGEAALLKHAALQMKKIGSDAQCSAQERDYLRTLRCTTDGIDVPEELSYLQSFLGPIKQWAEKRLSDYHASFADDTRNMELILSLAMVAETVIADRPQGMAFASSDTEAAARTFIQSSLSLAYERIVEKLDSTSSAAREQTEHPLTTLADSVRRLTRKEADVYAPILSNWHPQAVAIAASLLHRLYGQELRPFMDGISDFTDDVASVLPAADNLEAYLLDRIASVSEDGKDSAYAQQQQQLEPYQVKVVSEMLVEGWVDGQLSRLSEWVERTIQQENWEPVSSQKSYAGSIVEVFRIIDETTDQFFDLNLPMRFPMLRNLTTGFNDDLLLYVRTLLAALGDKADLISPPPTLTRYKRDMAVKATSKKKSVDPRLPDQTRTQEINDLTTVSLCVRLNTLHFIETQVGSLEDSIRERWAKKRSPNGTNSGDDWKLKRGPSTMSGASSSDELSMVFDGTRKAVNSAIDKICDFTGTKIIFWDTRETLIEGLYKISVAQARMEKVTSVLDPVLGQLCEIIAEPVRDRIVLGLLQAALEGLLRVLLDGGPTRAFAQSDSDMLEEDLSVLKEFFIADGDGLPRSVVNTAAAPVQQILNLYTLDTSIVIDSFKRASEQMVAGTGNVQRIGPRIATDTDTLLRVLCHRLDREASKFLKKHYNLPKV